MTAPVGEPATVENQPRRKGRIRGITSTVGRHVGKCRFRIEEQFAVGSRNATFSRKGMKSLVATGWALNESRAKP